MSVQLPSMDPALPWRIGAPAESRARPRLAMGMAGFVAHWLDPPPSQPEATTPWFVKER